MNQVIVRAPYLRPYFVHCLLISVFFFAFTPLSARAGYVWNELGSSIREGTRFHATIVGLAGVDQTIDEIAVTPDGEWVIIAGGEQHSSFGFPDATRAAIQSALNQRRRVDVVAFTPDGEWVLCAPNLFESSAGVPSGVKLQSYIEDRLAAGHRIDDIAFTPNNVGWVAISGRWWVAHNAPTSLFNALRDNKHSRRSLSEVIIGHDRRWVLLGNQWFASRGLSERQVGRLRAWQQGDFRIDQIVLTEENGYLLYGAKRFSFEQNDPIQWIEHNLLRASGGERKNIYRRMSDAKVAGVSLAVIDNNRVAFARGYGVLEGGTQRWVRTNSPFAVASMSKFITSLGMMRLSEDGVVDLDQDVHDHASEHPYGAVARWRLEGGNHFAPPENLPAGITPRRLMSHTAALRKSSSCYMPESSSIPTSCVLLGYRGCASSCSQARVWPVNTFRPGVQFRYANAGYEVLRAIAEDEAGISFEILMKDRLFEPLNMTNTTFAQPLSTEWDARSALPHTSDGRPLARKYYPWLAGGGLYTTPKDYAHAMIVLLNRGGDFITGSSVDDMLTDPIPADGTEYGYGVNLSGNRLTITEEGGSFSHNGLLLGGVAYSRMIASPEWDEGFVVIVNSSSKEAQALVNDLVDAFKCAWNWKPQLCG